MKYRLIFLQVLKVSDEPLGESNIERRVNMPASISKEDIYLYIYYQVT